MDIVIRDASDADFDLIWPIFSGILKEGDTYIYPEDFTFEQAKEYWMEETSPFVVTVDDKVVGTFVIRPNKVGRGSHVCNAGFMVHPDYRGKGIGRKMGEYALQKAKELGYHSMQFNIVVATNTVSLKLWQSLGFDIIGTVPQAFDHKQKGLVDAHIMYKLLS